MPDLNRRDALAAALSLPLLPALAAADDKPAANALTLVVSDPLAAPLACSCVKGFAQRDYDQLGKYLEGKLGRPVAVHYSPSLAGALKKSDGKADLIIGKDSMVRAEAAEAKVAVTHLACLTGQDGKTTQTGLVCVARDDKALSAGDLKDHKILFGPAKAEEKHAAALLLLKDLGVPAPEKIETCPTCTDGATKVIELAKNGEKVATVISSYALALLEGCGTIKKGDLRVVGETDPVPFIAAFATGSLSDEDRSAVKAALLLVATRMNLCAVLESKGGFVEQPEPAKKK